MSAQWMKFFCFHLEEWHLCSGALFHLHIFESRHRPIFSVIFREKIHEFMVRSFFYVHANQTCQMVCQWVSEYTLFQLVIISGISRWTLTEWEWGKGGRKANVERKQAVSHNREPIQQTPTFLSPFPSLPSLPFPSNKAETQGGWGLLSFYTTFL